MRISAGFRGSMQWFEKFSESPLNVSASTTRFPRNNHTFFVSEQVLFQCSCCRTVVVTTLRLLMCDNGNKLRFEQWLSKAKEIHADFQNTLGDSAFSYSTVAKWTSEFIFGQESLDVIRVVNGQKVQIPQNLLQKCIKWSLRFVDRISERFLNLWGCYLNRYITF
jgi:hypothetical protein